jgi:hypothetical protein
MNMLMRAEDALHIYVLEPVKWTFDGRLCPRTENLRVTSELFEQSAGHKANRKPHLNNPENRESACVASGAGSRGMN